MEQIGKIYYYQNRGGTILHSRLVRMTKAWYIFENGDWIPRYSPIYSSIEEQQLVEQIVKDLGKNIHVPDVLHLPNHFIK